MFQVSLQVIEYEDPEGELSFANPVFLRISAV